MRSKASRFVTANKAIGTLAMNADVPRRGNTARHRTFAMRTPRVTTVAVKAMAIGAPPIIRLAITVKITASLATVNAMDFPVTVERITIRTSIAAGARKRMSRHGAKARPSAIASRTIEAADG